MPTGCPLCTQHCYSCVHTHMSKFSFYILIRHSNVKTCQSVYLNQCLSYTYKSHDRKVKVAINKGKYNKPWKLSFFLSTDWWPNLFIDQLMVRVAASVMLFSINGLPGWDQGELRPHHDPAAGWNHGYWAMHRAHAQPDLPAQPPPGGQVRIHGNEGHCAAIFRWASKTAGRNFRWSSRTHNVCVYSEHIKQFLKKEVLKKYFQCNGFIEWMSFRERVGRQKIHCAKRKSRAGKIVGAASVATPTWGSLHEWTGGWWGR